MAVVKNDPFPGTDYSQYLSWQKVTAPDGSVYYVVPGFPGYVYDPVASNATGRKVFRRNPQQAISEKEEADERVRKEQELKEQQSSPAGQIVPLAATVGAGLLANEVAKRGFGNTPPKAMGLIPGTTNFQWDDGSIRNSAGQIIQQPPQPGVPAVPGVASPQAQAAAQGAAQPPGGGITERDILPGQSENLPPDPSLPAADPAADSVVVPPDSGGLTWQGGLQAAGGVAQAYSGYQQFQDGQELAGGANVLGGAYSAYSGLTGNAASYAPYVGGAVAAAQVGQNVLDTEGNSEDRAEASQAEALKAALLFIPGYGQAAYAAIAAVDAVSGGEATKFIVGHMERGNKLTDAVDFGLGKAIRSKVFHQSTRGVQKEHTGQLLQQSEDPGWQAYVQGMRAQHQEAPPDPTKPFAGKYATWDEYKTAGLDANDLTGVYGNLDAFKPDWAEKAGVSDWSKLTFDQQKAVTQALINADLYESKKGEVVVKDKEKARNIYQQLVKDGFKVVAPPAAVPGAAPASTSMAYPVLPVGPVPVTTGAQPGVIPAGVGRHGPAMLTPSQATMVNPLAQQAAQSAFQASGFNVTPVTVQPYAMPSTQAQAAAQAAMQVPVYSGPTSINVPAAAQPLLRSSTLSPGIGLDGRPIFYGNR